MHYNGMDGYASDPLEFQLVKTDLWFGVIYTNSASGTAEVGCVGEVIKHERLMITAVIAGLKEKNGSSRRVEGTVNIPFDLNSAGSRRRHGRPPKPQPEPVQNDVHIFVHGVQNSMATVPPGSSKNYKAPATDYFSGDFKYTPKIFLHTTTNNTTERA
ncbi:uncharacterized protein Fot_53654 [Forsythia ovata]|uniref:Uncharacterized protein n=1 Tax=Forsythia ovata TaxID=205694 RepID=A0ABD1PEW5_9LAMI